MRDKFFNELLQRKNTDSEAENNFGSWSFIFQAKKYLQEGNLDSAYTEFERNNCMYACGYCKFLDGDLKTARKLLEKYSKAYSFSAWLLILIDIIENKRCQNPTYFQIRNFYEQDIEMLFKYNRYDFLNKIFDECNFFANFNQEIYKYNARVLMAHGYTKESEKLLKKSLDICYKDPETHYLLGELYFNDNEPKKAKEFYQKAIEVNQGYAPAEEKLKNLIV